MFLQTFPKVDKSCLPFSHPQYFLYKFPEDVDSVIIKVASEKAYPCSVVSVQNIMVSSDPVSLLARKILMFQNRWGRGCAILSRSSLSQMIATSRAPDWQSMFADIDKKQDVSHQYKEKVGDGD